MIFERERAKRTSRTFSQTELPRQRPAVARGKSAAPPAPHWQSAATTAEEERAQAIGAAWGLVSLSDSSSDSVCGPAQVSYLCAMHLVMAASSCDHAYSIAPAALLWQVSANARSCQQSHPYLRRTVPSLSWSAVIYTRARPLHPMAVLPWQRCKNVRMHRQPTVIFAACDAFASEQDACPLCNCLL